MHRRGCLDLPQRVFDAIQVHDAGDAVSEGNGLQGAADTVEETTWNDDEPL